MGNAPITDEPEVSATTGALTADECHEFSTRGKTEVCHSNGKGHNLVSVSEGGCESHVGHAGDYVASTSPESPVYDPTCLGCLTISTPCDGKVHGCCDGMVCREGYCASQVRIYAVDGNTADYGDTFPDRSLLGMAGTIGVSFASDDFAARLLAVDPTLEDLFYASEAYDAAVIAALAAEIARSSNGVDIARHINAVTARGVACSSFAECRDLVNQGLDIDYDGQAGPLAFTAPGEPSVAAYGVFRWDEQNFVDWDGAETEFRGSIGDADPAPTPVPPPRETPATGGALKVGTLFPITGNLSFLGPAQIAAATLAVRDINDAGGVNGLPVTLVEGDSGDTETNLASETVDGFIADGVDVILGAVSSSVSLSVIDKVTGAGIVMFSPANTATAFTTYPDHGLYFRTAPSDTLQARAVAELMLTEGSARVGIMAMTDNYGTGLAENLKIGLLAAGIEADRIHLIYYDPGSRHLGNELEAAAADMKAFGPDSIAILGFDETVTIIEDLNALGIGPGR